MTVLFHTMPKPSFTTILQYYFVLYNLLVLGYITSHLCTQLGSTLHPSAVLYTYDTSVNHYMPLNTTENFLRLLAPLRTLEYITLYTSIMHILVYTFQDYITLHLLKVPLHLCITPRHTTPPYTTTFHLYTFVTTLNLSKPFETSAYRSTHLYTTPHLLPT